MLRRGELVAILMGWWVVSGGWWVGGGWWVVGGGLWVVGRGLVVGRESWVMRGAVVFNFETCL